MAVPSSSNEAAGAGTVALLGATGVWRSVKSSAPAFWMLQVPSRIAPKSSAAWIPPASTLQPLAFYKVRSASVTVSSFQTSGARCAFPPVMAEMRSAAA